MIYNNIPGKAALAIEMMTYKILTNVGSQPNHSAMPAHTPAIILFLDLVNLLFTMTSDN